MIDQAQFEAIRKQLLETAGRLIGVIEQTFPNDYVHTPGTYAAGSSTEYPMKPIAGAIDDILATFDVMQKGLGLANSDTARHERFLGGLCREPRDLTQEISQN